jgi:hypothetical protein
MEVKVPVLRFFSEDYDAFVCRSDAEDGHNLSLLFENVISAECLQDSSVNSVNTMHSQHDKVIQAFPKLLATHLPHPHITTVRHLANKTSASHGPPTIDPYRPDFLLHVNHQLLFWGVEKGSDDEWSDAVQDVKKKSTGAWPFCFAYAATPSFLQFFAIIGNMVEPVSESFNLKHVVSRLNVLRCMINVLRVLRTLVVRHSPTDDVELGLFNVVKRHNGTVERRVDCVYKVCVCVFVSMLMLSNLAVIALSDRLYTVANR